MRILNILFVMMFVTSFSFSQNAPVDFETGGNGAGWTWNIFENSTNPALEFVANPSATGNNTSTTVAKFTALQAGQPWAGCESAHGANLGTFVLNASNSVIKIMVYKTVISDVGIKLASASGWAQSEIKVANTLINQWEELTFDFSAYPNPPSDQYDQIIVFPDFNLAGRTQDNIVYFDNITFNAGGGVSVPTVAAPAPIQNQADVLSVFSGAYTNVVGTDFNPSWSQSTIFSLIDIDGDETMRYANFNYQGTTFASPLDVSTMEYLHLDMWTADATAVNIFCISTGPVETSYSLSITPNQWVSYNIPLTAFAGVNMADLIQFKFDGGTGTQTIYLDNIYFYKSASTTLNAPIDFETDGNGSTWNWEVFENSTNPALEIIANPSATGINTSATVAKFTALQAGQPWAGCQSNSSSDLGNFIIDASNSIVKIMVYKTEISDVGIKFANASGWSQGEIKVANTLINQWEELTFDFSAFTNPPAGQAALSQIIVFPDFNLAGRTQDNIVYFDNITFNAGGGVSVPTVAAPAPTQNQADVLSVFSDAYTNVAGTDFNPSWSQSTIFSLIDIEGNETMRYANFNYQGTTFASPLDVSTMQYLHLDMWTADATAVNIFCISTGPVETSFSLPITANEWVSYNIPLTAFSGVNMADLIQFKFDGGTGTQTIYLDNIYFYKQPSNVNYLGSNQIQVYPNPATRGTQLNHTTEVKQVEILDISGKVLMTSSSSSVINTENLNTGFYILKIKTQDNRIKTQKLIIN